MTGVITTFVHFFDLGVFRVKVFVMCFVRLGKETSSDDVDRSRMFI